MKNLYDRPWKIWSILGTVGASASTVAHVIYPVETAILIDTVNTVIKPVLESLSEKIIN